MINLKVAVPFPIYPQMRTKHVGELPIKKYTIYFLSLFFQVFFLFILIFNLYTRYTILCKSIILIY